MVSCETTSEKTETTTRRYPILSVKGFRKSHWSRNKVLLGVPRQGSGDSTKANVVSTGTVDAPLTFLPSPPPHPQLDTG